MTRSSRWQSVFLQQALQSATTSEDKEKVANEKHRNKQPANKQVEQAGRTNYVQRSYR